MITHTQKQEAIKVNFSGSFFVHHSLGMVNRELLSHLIDESSLDFRTIRYEQDDYKPEIGSRHARLLSLPSAPHQSPDIEIRHHWPPNLKKIENGKLVVIFPWEYGSLPLEWRDQLNSNVDEIWVYSTFLKKCYEQSGVESRKIAVIPAGVDPLHFNSQQSSSPLLDELKKNRFCFFYNGGVIPRKGTDILVNAYLNEFKADESVILIIKDSFSYGKELAQKIQQLSERNDIARIRYILQNVTHKELPSLYNACDCYVHPYRAEGYGLPIAEALACGKPVIVTGAGSSIDFVTDTCGYLLDQTIEFKKERTANGMETVDFPFWYIPNMSHLQKLMRHVFTNRDEAQKKGMSGEIVIKDKHTWKHAALIARDRLIRLLSHG